MRYDPIDALREALLNAIIHRDYAFGGSILITVFDDRMELISIGGLVSGISCLKFVSEHGSITRKEVEELLGISQAGAARFIRKLIADGKLIAIGNGKALRHRMKTK